MAVFTVKSCNFPDGFGPWARTAWLALCYGGSLWLVLGEAVFAQLEPLPTDLEGYQQFWAMQTPAQRLQLARRDPSPEPAAPTGASLLGDPLTLAEAQQPLQPAALSVPAVVPSPPPTVATAGIPALSPQPVTAPSTAPALSANPQGQETAPAKALTPEELNQQRLQRLLAEGAAAHAQRQAQQATTLPVPTLTAAQAHPPQPTASQAADLRVDDQPWLRSDDVLERLTPTLGSTAEPVATSAPDPDTSPEAELTRIPDFPESAPVLISQAGGNLDLSGVLSTETGLAPELTESFPLLQTGSPTEEFGVAEGSPLSPELLERFPLLSDLGGSSPSTQAALPPGQDLPGSSSQGSQIRQQ
ncbi:MAG: hypothetical protein Q6M04_01225, partial [Thermostichus sp. BF3_bins_97]